MLLSLEPRWEAEGRTPGFGGDVGKADGCMVSLVEKLEASLVVSAQESAQKRRTHRHGLNRVSEGEPGRK